jgi:hypothetical protein
MSSSNFLSFSLSFTGFTIVFVFLGLELKLVLNGGLPEKELPNELVEGFR